MLMIPKPIDHFSTFQL